MTTILERFEQILFQYHLSRGHYKLALAVYDIDINEDVDEELKNNEKTRRAAVDAEIAQLEMVTRLEMLATTLDRVSKVQLKRLTGDVFDFKTGRTIGPISELRRGKDANIRR